jgi:hypothetical protein
MLKFKAVAMHSWIAEVKGKGNGIFVDIVFEVLMMDWDFLSWQLRKRTMV